jgi:CRP-like cAMP-binding protein
MIGEVALYGGGARLAEVTAETECRLLRVDRRFIIRSDAGTAELVADYH